jgi:CheY-like chemotaxis protein
MPKVLVIDDEPTLCRLLTTLLTEEGFFVQTAAHGREGLGILQREGGWVVLLDLMMPFMDGRAVLQTLRANRALLDNNVVVLMSAAGSLTQDPQLLQEPVQAVLLKPFDLENVLAVINQVAAHTC